MGTLHELDEAAMIEILTQPKNALARQYQKQFEWDGIKLRFTDDALRAVARQACERKVGARGLRMILEELMLDAMYTLPSQKKMKELVVTAEMVVNRRVVFPLEKAG
jgi:ATP-dependent Clp protease ATP-binding subunit ClpX